MTGTGTAAAARHADAMGHAHRPDIEGLRAVAVSLVLLYHFFPGACPGGFVGVDVFFVISGFLITGIIKTDLEAGRFTFREFYARRFRRLVPSLAVMILVTMVLGFRLLEPPDFVHLAKTAKAAAWFTSNIYIAANQGYWDDVARGNALLHTWSLGVEEQFYLLWPVLLWLVHRLKRSPVLALGLVTAASFAVNLAIFQSHPRQDFFLLPSRIWELGAGAMLACAGRPSLSNGARSLAGVVGTLLIGGAAALLSERVLFPGYLALVPVSASCLLLAAGPQAWLNRRALAAPPLRFIGRISYQIYLWHWPLLVFAHARGLDSALDLVGVFGLTIALAWATQRFVERPFRYAGGSAPVLYRRAIPILAGCLATIALAGFLTLKPQLRYQRSLFAASAPAPVLALWEAQFNRIPFPRSRICFLSQSQGPDKFGAGCVEAPLDRGDRRPLVFLWGDSHAAHLFPGLSGLAARHGFRIAEFTATACPPIPGFVSPYRPNCGEINRFVLAEIAALQPAEVILSARWTFYDGHDPSMGKTDVAALGALLDRLAALKVAKRVVVGPSPEWDRGLPQILVENYRAHPAAPIPVRMMTHLLPDPGRAEPGLAAATRLANAVYVSPLEALCNPSGCLTLVPGLDPVVPVIGDADHLTPAGSELLVQMLRNDFLPAATIAAPGGGSVAPAR
jgi:peptidoglycan/LPS O-acetylase OafA/YrhL